MEKPKMYWWEGRDLADFFAEVNRRGSDNVRIEFHVGDGLLYVRSADPRNREGGDGGYNFVKTCPPDCPD